MLKMAALAPMPSASVRTTVIASPLARKSDRRAKRRSLRKVMAPGVSFLDLRACQCCDGAERRLRSVQAQTEILVGVRCEHVGRLMPLRIPATSDLRTALVLAQADRGDEILKRTGV